MDLLSISKLLIQNGLPILGKLVAGKKGEKVAKSIANFLGVKPALLNEKLQDPAFILRLKELENNKLELLLSDVGSAREMQKQLNNKFVDKLAETIIKYNMINVFLLVLINALLIIYSPKLKLPVTVIAPISNIFGIVIGRYLEERSQVTGFYFGSSIKSHKIDINQENNK